MSKLRLLPSQQGIDVALPVIGITDPVDYQNIGGEPRRLTQFNSEECRNLVITNTL